MTEHKLKIKTEYANKIYLEDKRWEVRLNDRDYKKGDILILSNEHECPYRVIKLTCYVKDIFQGIGLLPNYVILSFAVMESDIYITKNLDIFKEGN